MIRIGLLSDTHNYLNPKIFDYFEECDEIWHAGDVGTSAIIDALEAHKPVVGVYGNIDGQDVRGRFAENAIMEKEGLRVLMTHIGGYPPRYSARVKTLIKKHRPQLYICGHSHILKIMPDPANPGLLHINPGAAGKYGFHQIATLVRFSISHARIHDLQVIELGKRA